MGKTGTKAVRASAANGTMPRMSPISARRRGLGQEEAAIKAMPLPTPTTDRTPLLPAAISRWQAPLGYARLVREVLPTSLHATHDERPPRESSSPPRP